MLRGEKSKYILSSWGILSDQSDILLVGSGATSLPRLSHLCLIARSLIASLFLLLLSPMDFTYLLDGKMAQGLICAGIKCVDPDNLGCASIGFKAMECGIAQQNRPLECCEGLKCNADKVCEDPSDPLPTESIENAVQVGGTYCNSSADTSCYETGWPKCCSQKKPEKDCPIELPECEVTTTQEAGEDDTESPISAPTEAAPETLLPPTESMPETLSELETETPTIMTEAPTLEPTLIPTGELTDAPTSEGNDGNDGAENIETRADPTSSASTAILGLATFGAIVTGHILML